MKKPSSRIILTTDPQKIISLSANMKRESGTMRFVTTDGDKKILSLEELFVNREITLRCLKTENSPPIKYHCRFEKGYDLGPLVQYFSWNHTTNSILYLGDIDFKEQVQQLNMLLKIDQLGKSVFTVSENTNSIGLFAEMDSMFIGVIIDFTVELDGLRPFKIFSMSVPRNNESISVFYTSPQEGQEGFKKAIELIKEFSVKNYE